MDRDTYWAQVVFSFHQWRLAGADGANRAWRVFDDLVRERLLRYCARALERRRADVEGAVQDILIRIMEYADAAPAEADHFRCRLYKVARTVCADQIRDPRARSKSIEGRNWADPRPGTATQIRRKESEHTLRNMVDALPADDAEAMRMYYFEGRTQKTIARRRGQRTFIIRKQIEASRESLRPKLIAAGLAAL